MSPTLSSALRGKSIYIVIAPRKLASFLRVSHEDLTTMLENSGEGGRERNRGGPLEKKHKIMTRPRKRTACLTSSLLFAETRHMGKVQLHDVCVTSGRAPVEYGLRDARRCDYNNCALWLLIS